jgi:hypothetical protein
MFARPESNESINLTSPNSGNITVGMKWQTKLIAGKRKEKLLVSIKIWKRLSGCKALFRDISQLAGVKQISIKLKWISISEMAQYNEYSLQRVRKHTLKVLSISQQTV